VTRDPLPPASPIAVVVNDDPIQLNVLAGLVCKAGLDPRAFTGAEAALAAMDREHPPDLIVTDLYMPGIDGFRFCRLLRSPDYAAFNQVPILVVSATFAGDALDRIAGDLGADAFLPSPVDDTRFVEQVQGLLSGKQGRSPLRVLIVEDSTTLANILQKAFAAHGSQAETALTARAAADAFAKTAYDVAVLDYHLPDGPGDALLDAFRAERPDCVCLMMTTDPGPELALDWMKRGAAAYLRKPFQTDYLIELCAKARRERALLRVQDLLEERTRELRESEARYRLLFELESDAIVLIENATGQILEANAAAVALYGYMREELLQHRNTALSAEPDQTRRATAVGDRLVPVRWHRKRDGTIFPVEITSHHFALQGRPVHLAAIRDITARLQAEEILLARTDQLEAVGIVSREITRELHLDTVLHVVLQRALALLKAPVGTVYLWDEDSQRLAPGAWQSDDPRVGPVRLGLDEGVAGAVARERVGRIVNDYSTSPYAAAPQLAGIPHTAVLATPLLYGDRLLGVLVLANGTTERRFGPADLEFLQLLAAHAAIAIENARLHEATVRHAREQEALLQAARSLMKGLPLSEMLDRICKAAALVATTPHVKILLADKAANVLRLAFASGGAVSNGFSVPIGTSYSGTVAATGESLFIPDTQNDPANLLRERDRAHGIRTYLGLPITVEGEVLGVITFNTEEPHEYGRDEMEHLSSFADLAAVAIERTRLHETVEHRAGQLALVTGLTQRLMGPLEIQPLGDEILRAVQALIPGAFGRLWDMGEADDTLHLIASVGLQDALGGTVRFRQGEGLAGLAAAAKTPMTSRDIAHDPRFVNQEWAVREGLHAAVLLPLVHQERLYGILAVFTREVREFGEEDVRILQTLANHAAIAIENARLFTTTQQALADVQHAQGELVRTETLRGLGQMAAGIAHDLNNTLATVLGQAELAKLAAPPPEIREILGLIETAAADGAAVVRRVQEFARPKGTSPLAPCDLAALVRETLELTRPRWQAEPQRRGVTIDAVCDLPDLPPILGHPPELREALTNLVFNAVDAMPHGGTLLLVGRATADAVELQVRDIGIGMPPEVQAKIFEPFFTTKGIKGTGLGLAVVYGILERHGGRIAVTSALGQGTTFTLTFPRGAALNQVPGAPPTGAGLSSPRRLLVVDDEPLVRQTLATLLRAAGHGVTEAPDGATALALLATTPVDCVLTDLGMPGMSGWELARQVKAQTPPLPVLLLTGWGEQVDQAPAERAHVDRILGKPVQIAALCAIIAEVTGLPRAS
jgi:PAS domain S-box-containing protein